MVCRKRGGTGVSIHALLAECDVFRMILLRSFSVSIHALLAECDQSSTGEQPGTMSFNPRTPCGVRRGQQDCIADCWEFQSTHSLRSATERNQNNEESDYCFNPRTPCGVRPSAGATSNEKISFQSTHSLRSATIVTGRDMEKFIVSIHALLAECDLLAL